ncbi:uncharacterized protein [Nicotiana tomentosiformis]|uniref:uncharacterized protein n=1 Tax=Nicotiana tomentosiformis TaxID=4098 RepID=UPI00051B055A|nr:neurofilament heavy polypeptide-like [Nicotiana tomentosiformis]XP_009593741.1 neurofilament heavy polypeptide-like [Nicotiana tomentosiformis]XP_033510477.1 neurofilament heavy polypeptide-like [Nicotiana tomentosiformis]
MLEASSNMDPPTNEGDSTLEEVKEEGPLFSCNLFDAEMVRKVAQEFLTGLASACVDNTTGGLFKSPASVAVDVRREMVDYLIQRSETFVAESVVLDGGTETVVSDNPYDIISDFIDDFGQSKRNFFSKVSGWVLSERREDRIDDFVQEMEINGFWLMGRRETVAQTVIRNVDFKNTFHCNMKFKFQEELVQHVSSCGFREINCANEGCNARFSAAQLEQHDSTCPFKILQCEQKCPELLMRREMDRHCITVCPMKLVNCSFYPVGCLSTIPQCKADEHRQENLQSHLVYILKLIHKEASLEALKKRAEELQQTSSPERLAAARDARSLTTAIKNSDAKLGPLEVEKKTEVNPEVAELIDKKEDDTDISTNKNDVTDSPHMNEKSPDSPKTRHNSTATPTKEESPAKSENVVEPTSKTEVKEDSTNLSPSKSRPPVENEGLKSPEKNVVSPKLPKNEGSSKSPEEHQDLTASSKSENVAEPTSKTEVKEDSTNLSPSKSRPPVENEGPKSPDKNVVSPKLPKNEESSKSAEEHQDLTASSKKEESPKSEESAPSPKKYQKFTASPPETETPKPKESMPSPKKHHDSKASSPKMESPKSVDSTALGDKIE